MDILEKIVEKKDNLYFVQGFYHDNYLISLGDKVHEIKLPLVLLSVLRTSYDEGISLMGSLRKVYRGDMEEEVIEKIAREVAWINKRGVINLI